MCSESCSVTDHNEGALQLGCFPFISYPGNEYLSRPLGLKPQPEGLAWIWIHIDKLAGSLGQLVKQVDAFMTGSINTFISSSNLRNEGVAFLVKVSSGCSFFVSLVNHNPELLSFYVKSTHLIHHFFVVANPDSFSTYAKDLI